MSSFVIMFSVSKTPSHLAALASKNGTCTSRLFSTYSRYSTGATYSTLILNIDENCILVLIFGTDQTVGSMKYYAAPAVKQINEQLTRASARGETELDLSDMDATDVQTLFRRS